MGQGLKLIVTDGCSGLPAALEIVYARIPRRHCRAHKARNVLDKVPKRKRAAVKRDINCIPHAAERQESTWAFRGFCQKYRHLYPKALKSLERDIDDLIVFFDIKVPPDELSGLGQEKKQ